MGGGAAGSAFVSGRQEKEGGKGISVVNSSRNGNRRMRWGWQQE